jgi:hypothetical protein
LDPKCFNGHPLVVIFVGLKYLGCVGKWFVQIELLEWADDLEMHHLKGYGEALNYRMGVPLLDDVVKSMDRAMAADREFLEQIAFEI